ncbi:hypothetical protein ACH5RR_022536 [Cinchona calisaya]|uniref:Uncharacterized protein n=1 Tax=Cinchona calisaya TaxID=153742 RepID=A0ABD2Z9Q0_9GENT
MEDGSSTEVSAAAAKQLGKIIYIPEKPPVPPHLQPTVNVHAALIEPKHANTLVRKLNRIAPLENLRHVKRIRKKCQDGGKNELSVILCLASECDGELDGVPNDVLELIKEYQFVNMLHQQRKNGMNNASSGRHLIIHQHIISLA